jgi:hypothetical protein
MALKDSRKSMVHEGGGTGLLVFREFSPHKPATREMKRRDLAQIHISVMSIAAAAQPRPV